MLASKVFLGVENRQQPLALPEGSVRALISFSLLLVFVRLSTFICEGAKGPELGATPAQQAGSIPSRQDRATQQETT